MVFILIVFCLLTGVSLFLLLDSRRFRKPAPAYNSVLFIQNNVYMMISRFAPQKGTLKISHPMWSLSTHHVKHDKVQALMDGKALEK